MTVELLEVDHVLVEAIARRVVELLDERERAAGLVDAATVAQVLGVSRDYVYEHREELGAITVGDGVRPRLRFDLQQARAAGTACVGHENSEAADPPPAKRNPRRRSNAATRSGSGWLPIKGSA